MRTSKVFARGRCCSGLVLSGLVVTTGFETVMNYGHPYPRCKKDARSPPGRRKYSAQLYVHAVRFAFLLLEFPAIPISTVRELVEKLR